MGNQAMAPGYITCILCCQCQAQDNWEDSSDVVKAKASKYTTRPEIKICSTSNGLGSKLSFDCFCLGISFIIHYI